jgi:hypothetical protein
MTRFDRFVSHVSHTLLNGGTRLRPVKSLCDAVLYCRVPQVPQVPHFNKPPVPERVFAIGACAWFVLSLQYVYISLFAETVGHVGHRELTL